MGNHGKKYRQAQEKLHITKPFSFVEGVKKVKELALLSLMNRSMLTLMWESIRQKVTKSYVAR